MCHKSSIYQVDRVLGAEAKTEDVYDAVSHLVPFARSGGIGTLFAYGQTGSGKTFTVSGLEKMVVGALMEADDLDKHRIFITVIELAGNSAYGSFLFTHNFFPNELLEQH